MGSQPLEIGAAAALGNQSPSGPQRLPEASKQRRMIWDVMKNGITEDHINRALKCKPSEICDLDTHTITKAGFQLHARTFDHLC